MLQIAVDCFVLGPILTICISLELVLRAALTIERAKVMALVYLCYDQTNPKSEGAMAGKGKGQNAVRDAETGRFLPKEEAGKNPKTTVTETIKKKK